MLQTLKCFPWSLTQQSQYLQGITWNKMFCRGESMMEGEREANCVIWILGGKNLLFSSQAERVGGEQIKPSKKDQTDLKVQVYISRRSMLTGKKNTLTNGCFVNIKGIQSSGWLALCPFTPLSTCGAPWLSLAVLPSFLWHLLGISFEDTN